MDKEGVRTVTEANLPLRELVRVEFEGGDIVRVGDKEKLVSDSYSSY